MARPTRERIGILGGTFNPIHLGHLLIAEAAREQARLDRVFFIPCAAPPHKAAPDLASGRHRLAMIRRAIRGHRPFVALDLELRRPPPSYSVDTLATLKTRHPRAKFFFIIGSDSLPELPRWKDSSRLQALCRFIVVTRPGCALPRRSRHVLVTGTPCAIASRAIRTRCRQGRSIRYLVPAAVFRYILAHQLYQ